MTTEEVLNHFERAKVVLDWCQRGSERVLLESLLFGSLAITNECDSGQAFADYPIPSSFLFPEHDEPNLEEKLVEIVGDAFMHYWKYVADFEPMRKNILSHNNDSMAVESRRFLMSLALLNPQSLVPDDS